MPIAYNPLDSTLWLNDKQIGEISEPDEDGKVTVQFTISYRCLPGEAHQPLMAFATELAKLPDLQRRRPPTDLKIELPVDSIAEEFRVPRLLEEKHVKAGGYVWEFHKTDTDPWPSQLHGHDYERGLKLDALTGDVFDVGTRARCAILKKKALETVHTELRGSKDFANKLATLLQ
jgi:hypothetical protein